MISLIARLRSSGVSSEDIREAADVIEQWRGLLKWQSEVILAAAKVNDALLRLVNEDEDEIEGEDDD